MKFKAIFAISAALTAALLSVLPARAGANQSLQCGMTTGPTLSSLNALAKKYFPESKGYLEVQKALSDRLDAYYNVHNSLDPHNAKVVLLGEDHTNPGERFANQTLINALAKEGDVVLIEGAAAGQIVPGLGKDDPTTNLLKGGLWILGWDNMYEWTEMVDAFRERDSAGTDVLRQAAINQNISDLMVGRDSKMEDTISDTLSLRPAGRIFVIAGYEHLADNQLEDYLVSIDGTALRPKQEQWFQFKTETPSQYATAIEQAPMGAVVQVDNVCGKLQ